MMGIVGVPRPDLHEESKIVPEKMKDPIHQEHKTMRGHDREKIDSESKGKATVDSIIDLQKQNSE